MNCTCALCRSRVEALATVKKLDDWLDHTLDAPAVPSEDWALTRELDTLIDAKLADGDVDGMPSYAELAAATVRLYHETDLLGDRMAELDRVNTSLLTGTGTGAIIQLRPEDGETAADLAGLLGDLLGPGGALREQINTIDRQIDQQAAADLRTFKLITSAYRGLLGLTALGLGGLPPNVANFIINVSAGLWGQFAQASYTGDVELYSDAVSQWHRLALEVAGCHVDVPTLDEIAKGIQ